MNMTTDIIEQTEQEVQLTAQLESPRAEVLDKIIVARVGLLLRHPFLGNMATRLPAKSVMIGVPTKFQLMVDIYITTHNSAR